LAVLGKGSVKHFSGFLYFWRLIADISKSIAKREALGFGLIIGFIQSVKFTLLHSKMAIYKIIIK
jgi:hypothetical protein